MKFDSRKRHAGPFVGPAVPLLIAIFLLGSSSAWAQKVQRLDAVDSILGIRIGTSLDEVRSKLQKLGDGGGRDTRGGGRKEAWTLKETNYATLAFKTNGDGGVVWVTAFVRPGKEIAFSELGDLSKAAIAEGTAIWNVKTPRGGYRLVAKGANGKASVIYLLSLATSGG